MASPSSEPEKYSIDEMMERLRNRPTSEGGPLDGELVTRSDGSQAIKVRRRKRRSHQPHKEQQLAEKKSRMLQMTAVLVLLFVFLLLAGVAIIYSNSAPFREGLIGRIAASSGANVELNQFRMNPTAANANRVILTWPEGNALGSLDLRMVRAQVFPSSFLGKAFTGEEITAGTGLLTLAPPAPGGELRAAPEADGELPVRFKRYAVSRLDVAIGEPKILRLDHTEASLYPNKVNGRTQMLLNRGDLSITGMPRFRLDRAHIEFRGTETDIVGLRVRNPDDTRGIIEFSGTVSPYEAESASTLVVRLESLLLSSIAGPDLGHIISGRVDSLASAESNFLTFRPQAEPDAALAVEFRNAPTETITLQAFPFLQALHHLLDDPWFEAPKFDDGAKGVIRRANGSVTLGDLDFVGKGRLAVRGSLSMTPNRALSGELRIGVADAMIRSARNPRLEAMFGAESEGFRWITLKPSGSASAPSDNFRTMYEAGQQTFDPADVPPDEAGLPSFEDLTKPRR